MYKILITSRSFGKNSDKAINYLQANDCKVEFSDNSHLNGKELAKLIPGYDGLIVGIDEVSREVLEAADKLKVVCMHGTGIDHIDVESATEMGIYVGNVPNGNNTAVAEFTIGLILAASRHIPFLDKNIRKNNWNSKIGHEISEKIVGIVGLGNIGKKVVELLDGFNVRILAFDKEKDYQFQKKYPVEYMDLESLLEISDIISLHLSLNDETKHIIGEDQFNLMKDSAIFINTSRGELVDEKALYEALKKEKIYGAGLDAFIDEPLIKHDPIKKLDNVVLSPHNSASTVESANYVDYQNALTIVSVLKNQKLRNVLNSK